MRVAREHKFAIGVASVGVLLGIGWLLNYANDVCLDPSFAKGLGKDSVGCPEFWLNRYQTLFSAVIAGSIALWAGRLLFRQVEAQRADYLARLLRDVQDITDVGHDLFGRCAGPLSPDRCIRFKDGASAVSPFLEVLAIPVDHYSRALAETRDAMIRLETMSRRTSGPSKTATSARPFIWAVAEFLRVSEIDCMPRANFGLLIPDAPHDPVQARNDQSRESSKAVRAAWNEFFTISEQELAELAALQSRAHKLIR